MELDIDLTRLHRTPPSAFARKAKIKPAQAKAILTELKNFESIGIEQAIKVICKHLEAD